MINLKAMAESAGTNIYALANRIGACPAALYRRANQNSESVEFAIRVANELNCSLDALVGRVPPNESVHHLHKELHKRNQMIIRISNILKEAETQ